MKSQHCLNILWLFPSIKKIQAWIYRVTGVCWASWCIQVLNDVLEILCHTLQLSIDVFSQLIAAKCMGTKVRTFKVYFSRPTTNHTNFSQSELAFVPFNQGIADMRRAPWEAFYYTDEVTPNVFHSIRYRDRHAKLLSSFWKVQPELNHLSRFFEILISWTKHFFNYLAKIQHMLRRKLELHIVHSVLITYHQVIINF